MTDISTGNRARCFFGFIIASMILIDTQQALAQGFFRPIASTQSGRFIDAPRNLQQQLRDAERAIENDNFSEAVVRLGNLLQRAGGDSEDALLNGQDFFLDADGAGSPKLARESLFHRARQILSSLPRQARDTYQLRYGPLARKMLDDASASRDWETVAAVRRMYLHTEAGYDASLLLAKRDLFAGRPLSASLMLDEFVNSADAIARTGESVKVLHAEACHLANREFDPSDVTIDTVTIHGKSETLPAQEELANWLDSRFQDGRDMDVEDINYAMFGDKPHRNDRSIGESPLANERWTLDTTASPRQTRTIRQLASRMVSSGQLPPPSWTPIRVGKQLLMRTTERLVGVDFTTGKRVWMYPWFSTEKYFDTETIDFDSIPGEEQVNEMLSQRVWNDLPYGQITSDGQRVFMLDDLGKIEMAMFSPIMGMQGTRPSDTGSNTLVALDLATEGYLLWRIGKGEDLASTMSDAFFLGPPLPLEGRLYVMAEIAGDISLICLDPASGSELWRQHLVAVETGAIDTDPIRRVGGATPSYHEGLLICPTGAGACVAVDLVDRMLRWGATYPRNDDLIRGMNTRGNNSVGSTQLMQRWYSGAAIAADRSVLLTPIESNQLLSFNLLTGEEVFEPKERVVSRTLAGIRDGKFFLVGSNQMSAYDLQTGNKLWNTPTDLLSVGQLISGRGVFGISTYLLPTTTNQIVKVSLEDGSVMDRRDVNFQLGNLIAVDGELISQAATTLSVAYGEVSLGPKVERALKENPDDTQAMIRKAELMLQEEKRQEALELLAQARKAEPDNDEVLMLSVAAMLDALRESPEVDGEMVETLDQLIYEPDQRVELLALRLRAALQRTQYDLAASQLLELSSLAASESGVEDAATRIISEPSRHCSLDAWIAARSAEIVSALDTQQDAALTETVNALVEESLSPNLNASDRLLERLAAQFGAFGGSERLRTELSNRYQEDEQWLRAYGLHVHARLATDREIANLPTSRLLALAKIFSFERFGKDAAKIIALIRGRDDAPDQNLLDEISKAVMRFHSEFEWPDSATVQWEPRPRRMRSSMSLQQQFSQTTVLSGEQFRDWQLVSEGAFPLALRNPLGSSHGIATMSEARQREIGQNEAKIAGGAMVIVTPSSIVGVDLQRLIAQEGDSVMWEHNLSTDGTALLSRRSNTTRFGDQVFQYRIRGATASATVPQFSLGPLLGDRVFALQGGELMALDLYSGESIWRNAAAPTNGIVLSNGPEVAVVSEDERRIVFFNSLDGKITRQAPWHHGFIWGGQGKYVLSYHPTDDIDREYLVLLYDPFADQIVLQRQSAEANRTTIDIPASYGRIVGGRYLAMLDTEGKACVWDLVSAKVVSDVELPAYEDLVGLHAMVMADRFILLPQRRAKENDIAPAPMLHTRQSNQHETSNAVVCISLDSGEVVWQKEFDEAWGCTVHQPSGSPAVLLSRARSTFSPVNPRVRKRTLDFMALDIDDGHELASVLDKEVPSNTNELATQIKMPAHQPLMVVDIGLEKLKLVFGETSSESQTVAEPQKDHASDAP
ncbi:Outer membrane protein assembly factor BamB [Planctomycetes bacterium CA13]|uniref:Outer membrane protein assembly factor BamB n=1 Tax=Novipirellula herctigrandis TaxID=2527986 RepID=A0A5C5YVL7_9BACT|nr:Outer membrane protein assembly factor BamB [Planctomycetes bacterium CA13]